jgi:hypothetical protein
MFISLTTSSSARPRRARRRRGGCALRARARRDEITHAGETRKRERLAAERDASARARPSRA